MFARPRRITDQVWMVSLCFLVKMTVAFLALMAAALSPGGVLAVTVAGGDAEDVLDVVSLFEGAMPAGSAVVILENRDASHAWLRTPPSQVVLCLTPAADGAATPAASRLGMVERASRFEPWTIPRATITRAARAAVMERKLGLKMRHDYDISPIRAYMTSAELQAVRAPDSSRRRYTT